jgi:hypothetical protein
MGTRILRKLGSLALIASSLAVSASAATIDYGKKLPVTIKEATATDPAVITPRLHELILPELHTTVLFADDQIVRPGSQAVFVLFGGTGAKTKKYGIGASMSPIASKILKFESQFNLVASPVGFQNPVYDKDEESDDVRRPIVEKYGNTEAQVEWFVKTLELVVDLLPKDAEGNVLPKIWVGGRSTGGALAFELVHRYYKGDPKLRVISQIHGVLPMGVLGHSPSAVEKWNAAELKFLATIPGLQDSLVQPVGIEIFKNMGWASESGDQVKLGAGVRKLPIVMPIIGSNDPNSPADDQYEAVRRFSELHPELKVFALGMDTDHNPSAATRYTTSNGTHLMVPLMKRFSPVLEGVAAYMVGRADQELKDMAKVVASGLRSNEKGLRFHATPQFFDGPYINSCNILMQAAGLPAK